LRSGVWGGRGGVHATPFCDDGRQFIVEPRTPAAGQQPNEATHEAVETDRRRCRARRQAQAQMQPRHVGKLRELRVAAPLQRLSVVEAKYPGRKVGDHPSINARIILIRQPHRLEESRKPTGGSGRVGNV
jgi:hypothetical protein